MLWDTQEVLTWGRGLGNVALDRGQKGKELTSGKLRSGWPALQAQLARPAHANPVACGRSIMGPWGS